MLLLPPVVTEIVEEIVQDEKFKRRMEEEIKIEEMKIEMQKKNLILLYKHTHIHLCTRRGFGILFVLRIFGISLRKVS